MGLVNLSSLMRFCVVMEAPVLNLVDVSDIFNFFSARRRGRGSPGHREWEGTIFIESPKRGGSRGGAGRGGCTSVKHPVAQDMAMYS